MGMMAATVDIFVASATSVARQRLCGLAYVGPGAGFAVSFSLLTIVAVIVGAVLVMLFAPVSMVCLFARRRKRRAGRRGKGKTVIVGLDGLDPRLVRRFIDAGKMPHCAALAERGGFSRLATTDPPISPCAWSSFLTGVDPSRHGIYDFIVPDWPRYSPRLSSAEVTESGRSVSLGPCRLPLGRPETRTLRKGEPFWEILGREGFEATILRVPMTFPPEPFKGRLLSGMCVPDLLGSQGQYTYLALDDPPDDRFTGRFCRLRPRGRNVVGDILGPANPFRSDKRPLVARIRLRHGRGPQAARIDLPGGHLELRPGQTSGWVPVHFSAGPVKVRGLARFCLISSWPRPRLYMSALHIDPESPAMRISHPRIFSDYLAKRVGSYGTLGLIEDTAALNDGVLPAEAFLQHCWETFAVREKMLLEALEGPDDLVACVFDTPDRIQHMFWPRRGDGPASSVSQIEQLYRRVDALIGRVAERVGKDGLMLAVSDHGFTSFGRAVDLNAWLHRNGLLHLRRDAEIGQDWLKGVDWSRTKAYAMGLAGIYINRAGREGCGIVAPEEADRLCGEIKTRLESMDDRGAGENGQARPIRRVVITGRDYTGPYRLEGPDLIVGYEAGYRCSWQCARGRVGEKVFAANERQWRGDHCVASDRVPGTLLSSVPLGGQAAAISDIAPTVLDGFGVKRPEWMQGCSVLAEECVK